MIRYREGGREGRRDVWGMVVNSDGELGDVVVRVVVVSEGERAVLGLVYSAVVVVVVVGVGGGEVDAGTALEGGEEGGAHGGAQPARHLVQLLPRHDAVAVFHFDSRLGFLALVPPFLLCGFGVF